MRCARIASAWAGLSRTARRPPCTAGCSVLTRPSIISGKPVSSATSNTARPASRSVLRVPPVDTSSMPWPASARANSTTPLLSETEMRAREGRRRCSVMACSVMARSVMARCFILRRGAQAKRIVSGRQLPFLAARPPRGGAGGNGGGIGLLESPDHARHFPRLPIDHHLYAAARAVAAGEVDTVLQLDDLTVIGVEDPHLLVRRHQHDAAAVGHAVGFDRGVQMEAHGVTVARGADSFAAIGGEEQLLAFEPLAVGGERQRALMDDAVSAGVADRKSVV